LFTIKAWFIIRLASDLHLIHQLYYFPNKPFFVGNIHSQISHIKRYCKYIDNSNTVKPVLSGHVWDKENVALNDMWPLKTGSIHMKFYMTGQEECDILKQVTV
jgi:hypothetical protein